MSINLKLIAESRVDDPLNTWPDHNDNHSVTIQGNFLRDFHCLRCWLERVATEKVKKKGETLVDSLLEKVKAQDKVRTELDCLIEKDLDNLLVKEKAGQPGIPRIEDW